MEKDLIKIQRSLGLPKVGQLGFIVHDSIVNDCANPPIVGMKLNEDGGIAICIAAERPEGVLEENWLPLKRGDYDIDVILRIYVPDLEKFKDWTPPKAEKLSH